MWEAVDKCILCGSTNITLDWDSETWTCNNCGSGGGGANFWK